MNGEKISNVHFADDTASLAENEESLKQIDSKAALSRKTRMLMKAARTDTASGQRKAEIRHSFKWPAAGTDRDLFFLF